MKTIQNARAQMLATAFNNIGVSSIVAGFVAPLVSGAKDAPVHVAEWLVCGALFLIYAQIALGRLR